MKRYYPILVSKEGELIALTHIVQEAKQNMSPIIEVLPEVFEEGYRAKKEKKKEEEEERRRKLGEDAIPLKPKRERKEKPFINPLLRHLTTHWSFAGNQVLLDFKHCSSIDPKNIWMFLETLRNTSVNVIPIIGQNYTPILLDLVTRFVIDNDLIACIRVYGQLNGFTNNAIDSMTRLSNIPVKDMVLLMDAGYVYSNEKLDEFSNLIETTILNLTERDTWKYIIIASGSFPVDLSDFAAREEPHFIARYEWRLWNYLINNDSIANRIKYSDFGIKHPIHQDVSRSGSISIKYTAKEDFVIYRGVKTVDSELGNSQYIMHARKIVANNEVYPGEAFCWGDGQIMDYSKRNPLVDLTKPKSKQKPKPGTGGTWVAIGQNHHLTLLESLL